MIEHDDEASGLLADAALSPSALWGCTFGLVLLAAVTIGTWWLL